MSFNPAVSGINGATDVAISNNQDNQVLTYDNSVDKWRNEQVAASNVAGLTAALDEKAATDHSHTLDDLSDVAAASPTSGQVLKYNGTSWAPATDSTGSGGGGTGGSAAITVRVLSADAPSEWKDAASGDPYTFVCTGTNDQVQINAAVDIAAPLNSRNTAMPSGAMQLGQVTLSGGRFNIAAPIRMRTAVHLTGSGWATELRSVGNNSTGMITLAATNDHLVQISCLYLNGNYAAGGTCNAIDFDMTSSGSTGGYPNASPDSYHHIRDLFVDGFKPSGRKGIFIHSDNVANNRGNIITNIQMRNIDGDGISLDGASDCFISQSHVGTCGGNGVYVASGNTKVNNVKTFYCDGAGFYVGSGRHVISACESQDNAIGFYLAGADSVYTGLIADTSSTDGIVIASARQVIESVSVFLRGGARYSTQTNGIRFTGSHTDTTLVGRVSPSSITNPLAGSPGARSFMRVSDGSSLNSAG